ncbi:MAG: SpoIIIAH-like family protein [Bacillota bacterium]|nr:SpoIIIAH-like family protein [Bacillota bacterium]
MISVYFDRRKLLLGVILIFLLGGCWFLSQQARFRQKSAPSSPVEVEISRPREMPGQLAAGPTDLVKEEFFVECRLARDRIRSQQIELYQEVANNPASSGEVRDRALRELMKLTENMGKETELEKLIMARGFKDAVVLIQPKSATVIVQTRSLSTQEVNKITDLVAKTTELDPANITIIPKP